MDEALLPKLALLSTHAELVAASLRAEYLPKQHQLASDAAAETILEKVLASEQSPLTTLRTLQEAEMSLSTTEKSLAALKDGGLAMDDAAVMLLFQRLAQQTSTAELLRKGAPSAAT